MMSKKEQIEFDVEYSNSIADKITVAGRCTKGAIYEGDIFRYVYRYNNSYSGSENNEQVLEKALVGEVFLKVEKLEAYGKALTEMDTGITGWLTLCGKCAFRLEKRMFLGSEMCN